MAKQTGQKIKLLYLRSLLLEHTDESHILTMDDILYALKELGVSAERKGIYNDLQVLREYGMDVRQRGRRGGYYLANRDFSLAELKLLVDAVQSSRFITQRKSQELIHKVEALASNPQAYQLQRQVYVLGRAKTVNENIYRNIDTLHSAINDEKQVSFRYFEWCVDLNSHRHVVKRYRHGGKMYHISPWALMWDHENYYMIGYDKEAGISKHYRVDKMDCLRVTEQPREGGEYFENFDLAVYARKTFGMFHGHDQWVRLRCENRFIGVLHDRFGDELLLAPCDEAHFYAGVNVAVSPQFYAWVFGLGGAVQIAGPPEVVGEFQQLLKKFL